MKCTRCQSEISNEMKFCPVCGYPNSQDEILDNPSNNENTTKNENVKYIYYSKEEDLILPERYRPLSALGFLGYLILFSIPLLGWIIALIFSFNPHNLSRRNLARAIIIAIIICLIIAIALYFLFPNIYHNILFNSFSF